MSVQYRGEHTQLTTSGQYLFNVWQILEEKTAKKCTGSTFVFIHQHTALAKYTMRVIYFTIAAVIKSQMCSCMASDKHLNQTSFTMFYTCHTAMHSFLHFASLSVKNSQTWTFCVTIDGVRGSALYLLAGIVSAESHLGHLHFEVIRPLSSALWEQGIIITPESKTGEIKNQKMCLIIIFSLNFTWNIPIEIQKSRPRRQHKKFQNKNKNQT